MKTCAMEDMRNTQGVVKSKINPLLKTFSSGLSDLQLKLQTKNQQ